jgi:hypothetical protein
MKKQRVCALVVLMAAALPAFGQKVLTQKPGSTAITRVETALNHLTVVELHEPVLSVASGSQAFRVEWRGNKVFIEPTEANVSTNLFIWTKSGRLNYELEPAGQVAQMDFAIDQPVVPHPPAKPVATKADPSSARRQMEAALLGAVPVEMGAYEFRQNRVQLLIKDIARRDDLVFIRYEIVNSTNHTFEILNPQVFFLESPRSRISLFAQRNSQIPDSERIESDGLISLDVIHQEVEIRKVQPDGQSVGLIEVKAPPSTKGPAVLRVVMPDSVHGEVSATFVL